jgi:hypothetical protein
VAYCRFVNSGDVAKYNHVTARLTLLIPLLKHLLRIVSEKVCSVRARRERTLSFVSVIVSHMMFLCAVCEKELGVW